MLILIDSSSNVVASPAATGVTYCGDDADDGDENETNDVVPVGRVQGRCRQRQAPVELATERDEDAAEDAILLSGPTAAGDGPSAERAITAPGGNSAST